MSLNDRMSRWIMLIAGATCAKIGVGAVNQAKYIYAAQAALVGVFAVWAWSRLYLLSRRRSGVST